MNTISLSVYSITLYKRFKNKDLENLSSFDHGKDFLSLVDQLFLSWKQDVELALYNDEQAKKVSRLRRIGDDCWEYHRHTTFIDGIIESGEYGTQEDIIEIKTGRSKYVKKKEDASLRPFYFMFYHKPNTEKCFLLVERIGQNGIVTVLEKALREFLSNALSEEYTLVLRPYLMPKVLKLNMESVGGAKRVILKGIKNNAVSGTAKQQMFAGCATEVSFVAPKNNYIPGFETLFEKLKKEKDKGETCKIDAYECQDVAFEVSFNGKTRMLSVANITNMGMNVDVTNRVKYEGATGYPTYASLNEQAHQVLSYLDS